MLNRVSGINSVGTNSDGGGANVITLEGITTLSTERQFVLLVKLDKFLMD